MTEDNKDFSVEQMRAWLMGAEVKGLPDHWSKRDDIPTPEEMAEAHELRVREIEGASPSGVGLAEKIKRRAARIDGRYTISMSGSDATLNFGKNSGELISRLATNPGGQGYLRWILKEGFPNELKEIVKEQLEKQGRLMGHGSAF